MSDKKKIDDERLKIEMQEISNRINDEMCEIFSRLGAEEKQYELVAGATVLSFVGVLIGHSQSAAEALFDVLSSHEKLLRSVIDLIRTTDGKEKKDDDGGTLH